MVSDRLGEAARGFGVLGEHKGLPRAERSVFLVSDETVVASWWLGRELPDVEAIVAATQSAEMSNPPRG